MTQFSPKASFFRRCAFLGLAVAFPNLVSAAPKPTALPTKVTAQEGVFFTVQSNGHSVLGRCDAQGSCKVYLGTWGQGWQSYPNPHPQGDDLIAAGAPDGSHFALISTRGGGVNVWLVSADGLSASALTEDEAGILPASEVTKDSLAFSPDGKSLAYIDRGELWVMTLADRQTRTLTFDGGIRALCWAPSGEALAVVQNTNLRRVALDGSSNTLLVGGQCAQPLLAWSRNPSQPDDVFFFGRGAERVDSALETTLLMPSTVQPNSLALLPTGVALLVQPLSGTRPEVFMAGFSGAPTQVTQGGADAVWAPADGQSLYFLRDQVLWRCGLDGSKAKPLGAVPVDHVSLGLLLPPLGACR